MVGGISKGRGVKYPKFWKAQSFLSSDVIINSGFEWRSRLVVLSACDTYSGKVFAEGVLNLPRAFIAVGIPCTVVSQWPNCSSEFMTSFYQNLRKGSDVASALRLSTLDMLRNKVDLYMWGLMIVSGLPNVKLPIELLEEM